MICGPTLGVYGFNHIGFFFNLGGDLGTYVQSIEESRLRDSRVTLVIIILSG